VDGERSAEGRAYNNNNCYGVYIIDSMEQFKRLYAQRAEPEVGLGKLEIKFNDKCIILLWQCNILLCYFFFFLFLPLTIITTCAVMAFSFCCRFSFVFFVVVWTVDVRIRARRKENRFVAEHIKCLRGIT